MALGTYRLTPPPCIPGLIGCDGSGESGTNEGVEIPHWDPEESNGGVDIPKWVPESDRVNIPLWTPDDAGVDISAQTSSSSSGLSGKFSQVTAPLRGARSAIAQYTLTLKNRGNEALKGVKVLHGPLPFGAIFEPSRSSSGCTQIGNMVECLTDLLPGESKDLTVGYTVSNAVSCAIARVLQSAKVVSKKPTGEQNNDVSAFVNCSMVSVSSPAGTTESSSASTSSVSAVMNDIGVNSAAFSQGAQSSLPMHENGIFYLTGGSSSEAAAVATRGSVGHCQAGYDDQGVCMEVATLPNTGAPMAYLTASTADGITLTPFTHPETFSLLSGGWFILPSVIVIAMISSFWRHFLKFKNTFI